MYDYLIVGSGLFGAIFAHEAMKKGKTCLVLEKRDHIGGNIYTEEVEGIQVHKYGAHSPLWCPHFPYKQQRSLGLHSAVCRI